MFFTAYGKKIHNGIAAERGYTGYSIGGAGSTLAELQQVFGIKEA